MWLWPAWDRAPVALDAVRVWVSAPPGGAPAADEPDPLRAGLELPLPGERIERGPVRVVGWALTDLEPVSRVEVLVNGRVVGRARIGVDRPEVARRSHAPHAGISGFEALIDLVEAAGEQVELEVQAWTLDGRAHQVASRRYLVVKPQAEVVDMARLAVLQRRLAGIGPRRQPADDLDLVVFAHDLGLGGAQLWLSELLRRAGAGTAFPCTVVAPVAGPLLEQFEAQGIEVRVCGPYPTGDVETYEGRMAETAEWLSGRRHSAAMVNSFGSFFGADAATRVGLPTVWAIHESWTPTSMWAVGFPPGHVSGGVRRAVARAMSAANAMVFVAEATRRQYEGWAGPGRTAVVPYGIDTAGVSAYCDRVSPAAARQATGLPADARVLLVMGSTERRKGQSVVAEAFARLADAHPEARVVFVGDNGNSYAAALADYLHRAGLDHQVNLVPVVEDIYQWYRSADALVCASDIESLPRSVLEAMCFGIPVLATSVFGLPELLDDGATGLLFEPLDLGATVDAIERLLGMDPAELQRVAAAGRRLVLDSHDSAGYAADIVALIEALRADPGASPAGVLAATGRPPWPPAPAAQRRSASATSAGPGIPAISAATRRAAAE